MTQGDVETYFSCGAWRNRVVGRGELPGQHASRQQAVRVGSVVAIARHVHHLIRYAGPGGAEDGVRVRA
ncbi:MULTISPECIES: hypothetical protein [unclassified Nocardioides]|uniref:hypothetical protein n=1 Tax=unclassified Nocardioides TaxID=2615069 RepID=UPI0030149896